MLAVGDLHGDGPPFLRFLLYNGLIGSLADNVLRWDGAEAILVQTGDIPDRGPHTVLIAQAVIELRRQGARIFTLIGNHDVPYLITPDAGEQRRRIEQALPYMLDSQGRSVWEMPDVELEYSRQATVITQLHQHPDGGLVALRLGDVLFLHGEPGPITFCSDDYDALEDEGLVRYQPARHTLDHRAFWGRAYSCGTDDPEGGYQPKRRSTIPPARSYEPAILRQHEEEPEVAAMYDRLRRMGIRAIVHGHVPGPSIRTYRVGRIEHFNIDEAICRHYRTMFGAMMPELSTDGLFVPEGWIREPARP